MECISHHEAIARLIKEHDEIKPFPPENGQKLKFKVGDKVNWLRGNTVVSEVEFNGYKFWIKNINFNFDNNAR